MSDDEGFTQILKPRPFDIVVFGATGFSGKLLAAYLARHYSREAKLAFAGRNKQKIEKLRQDIADDLQDPSLVDKIPILIADSGDLQALIAVAEQTKCVATTVGPYAIYGTPLVEACARTGTSYCDLTGEASWHATMFNLFEVAARDSGARVVHQAGFDSVPSDVGVHLAARSFREKFGRDAAKVEMFVTLRGGGVQGGTMATVLNEISNHFAVEKAKRESMKGAPPLPKEGRTRLVWAKGVGWSAAAKRWTVPFFMAPTNMPCVARSNGRLNYAANLEYGECSSESRTRNPLLPRAQPATRDYEFAPRCRYMVFEHLLTALAVTSAMVVAVCLLLFPPTRWLLQALVIPKPGQGPSKAAMEASSWRMLFVATGGGGERLDVHLDAVGDASCISTTCCLGESAMALSKDAAQLTSPGGVMPPAAAMGDTLLKRLRATPLFKIEPTAGAW